MMSIWQTKMGCIETQSFNFYSIPNGSLRKSHRRSHDFDGQTMLPLVTLALILTAISCAIDLWETGEKVPREFDRITYCPKYDKHLKRLSAWAAFSAKPSSVELAGGHDLCTELREDLLRNSRASLPTIAQQPATTAEEEDEAAMLAEFEANFAWVGPPAVALLLRKLYGFFHSFFLPVSSPLIREIYYEFILQLDNY